MKRIRYNVFETNSSSTHTITVSRENVAIPITGSPIYVRFGEYGWEYACYTEPEDILSYLYTAICANHPKEYQKYVDKINDVFAKNTNIKLTWETPEFNIRYDEDGKEKYRSLQSGYIDHSNELEDWLEDLFKDDELLLKTVFQGEIITDNDNTWNDEDYCNFGNGVVDSYTYYKGN